MKRFGLISSIVLLSLFTMGSTECHTTDTVVLAEGPKAAQLGAEKDKQIVGLTAQVKAEQDARLMEQALASKAASGLKGIQKAREYLDDSPAKEAIGLESDLALTRLPPDDPAETVKSLERVVLIVTGQRDAALKKYAEANAQTAAERAAKEAKEKEIAALNVEIESRKSQIATLEIEKAAEVAAHKADVEKALKAKDAEIKKIKDDFASKERATWVLWTRIAGLGFIVAGALVMIFLHIVPEGAALVGVGVVIGLVSIFIDWLTSQAFFPYLMGFILLAALVAAGIGLYRLWKAHTLSTKVTAALQDLKDESTTLGNDVYKKVEEHLDYRLGDKGQAALSKLTASLGLIDPKGETAIKDKVDVK